MCELCACLCVGGQLHQSCPVYNAQIRCYSLKYDEVWVADIKVDEIHEANHVTCGSHLFIVRVDFICQRRKELTDKIQQ